MIDYLASVYPQALALLVINLLLVGWCFVSIACRFAKMSKHSDARVAWQYVALAGGNAAAFAFQFAPELRDWSLTAALLGVVVYLMLSAHRWRHGMPPGLNGAAPTAPYKLEPGEMRRVAGGRK